MTQDRFKFRGKRIDNGEWVYGGYVYPNAIEYIEEFLDEKTPSAWVMVSHEIDPKTVGQCTGLLDKNGVLIFDHDYILTDLNERRPYYRSDFYDSFIGKGKNIVEMLVCWHFAAWHACIPIFKNGELVSAESYAPLAGFEDIQIVGNYYEGKKQFVANEKFNTKHEHELQSVQSKIFRMLKAGA